MRTKAYVIYSPINNSIEIALQIHFYQETFYVCLAEDDEFNLDTISDSRSLKEVVNKNRIILGEL